MQKTVAVLVPLIVVSLAPQAKADIIIYDNLAATTYSPVSGSPVYGATFATSNSVSTSFVAATSGDLTDILVPISLFQSGSPLFNFSLTNASNTVLESWTGLTAPNQSGTTPVVDIVSLLHPQLNSGDTYTLTASANNNNTHDAWELTESLTGGLGSRLLGTPVPEPGSLILLGTGLLAFGGLRVRRWRRG